MEKIRAVEKDKMCIVGGRQGWMQNIANKYNSGSRPTTLEVELSQQGRMADRGPHEAGCGTRPMRQNGGS